MDDEQAMLTYSKLAEISARKQQLKGRDRFLILAGIAATRSGWADVAARCRDLVVADSPRHVLARYATFADALRDSDFEAFSRQIRRFCSLERAEHLLEQLNEPVVGPEKDLDAGTIVLRRLQKV